ncbi:hypothetical protein JL720_4158 [Aureococcus anophagefferens]|nr:hypothetical protein JL720_4158 [Aureococcus anophagefferens]
MVYLRADGTVVEKRSMWRLSIVPDFLWGVVDFFWLFVSTLINPQSEHNSLRPKRSSGGATGRGGGGGRPGGSGGGARKVKGLKDCSSSSMSAARWRLRLEAPEPRPAASASDLLAP